MTLPEALEQVCAVLGSASPSVADVEQAARKAGFGDARVVATDDGILSHADLGLAEPVPVAVLREAFGEPTEPPRLHYDRPRSLIFRLATCAVIARVADADADEASEITVRRDV
jgi:hypothetical protein